MIFPCYTHFCSGCMLVVFGTSLSSILATGDNAMKNSLVNEKSLEKGVHTYFFFTVRCPFSNLPLRQISQPYQIVHLAATFSWELNSKRDWGQCTSTKCNFSLLGHLPFLRKRFTKWLYLHSIWNIQGIILS